MKALSKAFNLHLAGTELPLLAQRVENLIVGAPCGLMDQLTSFFGMPRMLLPIVCQPDKISEPISLPSEMSFLGIDSGIRHSVSGSSYAAVRCSSFMGYSILAHSLGVRDGDILECIRTHDFSTLPFGGYLCNIPLAEFEKIFQPLLPDFMDGKDFLSRYNRTIDPVTSVQPTVRYAIRNCTSHPIYENERVQRFRECLLAFDRSQDRSLHSLLLDQMGELMHQSHASYSLCGLGSSRTDEIVDLANVSEGIGGAKITGGGSGGTVCLLACGQSGKEAAKKLQLHLMSKYKTAFVLFEG
jgi:L-arabinokinase